MIAQATRVWLGTNRATALAGKWIKIRSDGLERREGSAGGTDWRLRLPTIESGPASSGWLRGHLIGKEFSDHAIAEHSSRLLDIWCKADVGSFTLNRDCHVEISAYELPTFTIVAAQAAPHHLKMCVFQDGKMICRPYVLECSSLDNEFERVSNLFSLWLASTLPSRGVV